MKKIVVSVACFRQQINDKTFVGCGRGWTQKITDSMICVECGRQIFITGRFMEIELNRKGG